MSYNPTEDLRVIAVKDWSWGYSDQAGELVDSLTDWEISDNIKFTRTGEGAVAKFMRTFGFVSFAPARPPKILKRLVEIDDPDELIVEMEERGVAIQSCPTCFMMVTRTGACYCAKPVDNIPVKLALAPVKKSA